MKAPAVTFEIRVACWVRLLSGAGSVSGLMAVAHFSTSWHCDRQEAAHAEAMQALREQHTAHIAELRAEYESRARELAATYDARSEVPQTCPATSADCDRAPSNFRFFSRNIKPVAVRQAAHSAAEEARWREVQEVADDRDEHVRRLAAQHAQVRFQSLATWKSAHGFPTPDIRAPDQVTAYHVRNMSGAHLEASA